MREARWIALRVVLIGVLLSFPLWGPPLMRRIDPQTARRELAIEAERAARRSGELFKGPAGETRRAVVYTPVDPAGDTRTTRYITWMCRLVALTLVLQLFIGDRRELEPDVVIAADDQ